MTIGPNSVVLADPTTVSTPPRTISDDEDAVDVAADRRASRRASSSSRTACAPPPAPSTPTRTRPSVGLVEQLAAAAPS